MAEEQNQQNGPANIGAGDAPRDHRQRKGIAPPAIQNNNFEIKSGLISMIQGNKFHGLPMEDPLDHLDEFDRLCNLTKINGVSEDGFKLRLFPFSLGDKAHIWEKNLSHDSITTWDDYKKAFLSKFFSNARTARLRNEIYGFSQKTGESFCEAWERFKGYTNQCPHHSFTKASLLSTLYRGVLPRIRMLLDTASNGNFQNKDVEEGWELVENLAQSDGNYNEDCDRTVRGTADSDDKHRKEIKALNDKLDRILLSQQKHVHFLVDDEQYQVQDGEGNQLEEVYLPQQKQGQNKPFVLYNQGFVPKQQFQGNYQPPPPPGFVTQQNQCHAAPDAKMKQMVKQLLQGQASSSMEIAKKLSELHHKLDCSYNDLNAKVEALNTKVRYLEGQSASTFSPKVTRLPGKSIQNPKEYATAHAITICHDRELPTRHVLDLITRDNDVQEGEASTQVEASVVEFNHSAGSRHLTQSTSEEKAAIIERMVKRFKPTPLPLRALPWTFRKAWMERYKSVAAKQLDEIEAVMPLMEVLNLILDPHKVVRNLILERIKMYHDSDDESDATPSRAADKRIVQEKLEDPGSFTLPCSIGEFAFSDCLCDLGASVNLMPLSMARRLEFIQYKPCDLTLILADRSSRKHFGMLKDLPVMINGVEVPTDFVVLDMEVEHKDPLILGRPFLASVGAVIDVKEGKIGLNLGKHIKLQFNINRTPQGSTEDGRTSGNDRVISREEYETERVKEFKKRYDKQDETIEKLAHTVEERRNYPLEEKEAYFEEKGIEYSAANFSRENAEYDDDIREDYADLLYSLIMSNYSGESSMDPDYNVDEVESWSARPREQHVYQSFRDEFERSTARHNQRRAEIARGKRAMSSRYELIDEDIETEYEPESWRKETKLLNKPDEVTVEEYIRFFEINDFWGTRYSCYETLAQLRLLEDVQYLFEKCHLETLMSYPYPAYKEETIEFLSTLQVEMYEALTDFELDTMGLGFLTFLVDEQRYQLSIKKLEELFGFPSGKGTKPRFDREELKDLWATIGNNLPLNSARYKSNQIWSPVIRYFQQSVANVFYSKESTGTVSNTNMEMIDYALIGILRRTKGKNVLRGDLNNAPPLMPLLIHLCGYRKWALTNGKKKVRGALCVGGVVTPILEACGVSLKEPGLAPRMMDLDHLRRCEFLEFDMAGDFHRYRFEHSSIRIANILLPCIDATRILEGRNIDFKPALEDLYFKGSPPTDEISHTEGATTEDVDETDDIDEAEFDTSMYHFSEHIPPARESKSLSEAHRNNNKLQKWCKKQDKLLAKCLRAISAGLSLESRRFRMSMRDIHHSSLVNLGGRGGPHSLDLAAGADDFCSLVVYATAVLAAAEGKRLSILRAVLAATELMMSSTHLLELIQNKVVRPWPGSNHKQPLMSNYVHSSTEVSASLHHCIISSVVICFFILFL
ncbi:AT4g08050 [Arabidopsis thaliana]|uniref:AT4g08050 protein n=1 Tax=Arabidopsis thaliana TaxID=3702 RepID=Q7FZN4_ARATH|nr:hypothetical protein AT4g08050 [imported] - Arabidopsis thaliana [Arabidopsis thaliana]AAD48078.1 contains similarity to retrotransposons; may be a pseudogene [Arabidopsis thaliana]CAB81142.1 AT4g08050 [Arabidopsis thaliana]